jgi:hypothetical protein
VKKPGNVKFDEPISYYQKSLNLSLASLVEPEPKNHMKTKKPEKLSYEGGKTIV